MDRIRCLADRGDGLAVLDDVDALVGPRRPSVFSLFRPKDVTLYDLLYEPYIGSRAKSRDQLDEYYDIKSSSRMMRQKQVESPDAARKSHAH